MKALRTFTLAIVIGTIALSSTLFAATPENKKVEQTLRNFLFSMESQNTGVVESSIVICIELKSRYPEYNFQKIQDRLNELATEGATPLIKYRAQVASLYFSNYTLFSDIRVEDKTNPEKTFRAIIDRLENLDIASN